MYHEPRGISLLSIALVVHVKVQASLGLTPYPSMAYRKRMNCREIRCGKFAIRIRWFFAALYV